MNDKSRASTANNGFTAEERAPMKERAAGLRAQAKRSERVAAALRQSTLISTATTVTDDMAFVDAISTACDG